MGKGFVLAQSWKMDRTVKIRGEPSHRSTFARIEDERLRYLNISIFIAVFITALYNSKTYDDMELLMK